jgi:hypothetical protein
VCVCNCVECVYVLLLYYVAMFCTWYRVGRIQFVLLSLSLSLSLSILSLEHLRYLNITICLAHDVFDLSLVSDLATYLLPVSRAL